MSTPRDFTMKADGTGYCVQGTVYSSYDSVALMGFNLNETPTGSATQCAYNPAASTMMGPPGVTLSGNGLAINFTKTTAPTFRVQVQGPNGATDANDRWCATITPAAGPVFIPWASFNTKCWDMTGTAFTPTGHPISAIAFLVPGTMGAATPFNYCVTGFATGSAATDAPTWGTGTTGPQTGTLGGPGGMNLDFQRVKVAKSGKSYIIQNNNWGNPNGSDQTLTYSDNSFNITQSTGSGSQAPASFPSIFIGANGDVQAGTYSTRSDDHLPKQISGITSLMSTFRHTGTSGSLNATYDIWFSDHMPTGARYDDAISGFIMLWLYDPPNAQPIGSVARSNVSLGGKTWNVWVGPRGSTGATCEGAACGANRPVVSYVATSTSTSFSGDLKPFFADAAQNGIGASWYLTDVFAGFECWSGSDCVGKQVQEFTAVVAP
jgi:xyloglucan-specific endo-beta-1,4-glucanase